MGIANLFLHMKGEMMGEILKFPTPKPPEQRRCCTMECTNPGTRSMELSQIEYYNGALIEIGPSIFKYFCEDHYPD